MAKRGFVEWLHDLRRGFSAADTDSLVSKMVRARDQPAKRRFSWIWDALTPREQKAWRWHRKYAEREFANMLYEEARYRAVCEMAAGGIDRAPSPYWRNRDVTS